jgi:hypothetical protein
MLEWVKLGGRNSEVVLITYQPSRALRMLAGVTFGCDAPFLGRPGAEVSLPFLR